MTKSNNKFLTAKLKRIATLINNHYKTKYPNKTSKIKSTSSSEDFLINFLKGSDWILLLLNTIIDKSNFDNNLITNSTLLAVIQENFLDQYLKSFIEFNFKSSTANISFFLKFSKKTIQELLLSPEFAKVLANVSVHISIMLETIKFLTKNKKNLYIGEKSKHKQTSWSINSKMQEIRELNTPLPIEIPINKISSKNLCSQPINGSVVITDEEEVLNALNITQETVVTINVYYLQLLEKLNQDSNLNIKTPWPTDAQILHQEELLALNPYHNKENKFKTLQYICDQKLDNLGKKLTGYNKKKLEKKIYRLLNITFIELKLYSNYLHEKNKYIKMCHEKNRFLRCIFLAKRLSKRKFRISKRCDYRLRIYEEGILTHASGYLKNLLTSPYYCVQNWNSFQYILLAYYKNDPFLYQKLQDKLLEIKNINISPENSIKIAIEFFNNNPILLDATGSADYLYLNLLAYETRRLIDSKKFWTNFQITIDQKTSGVVLLSKLFQDRIVGSYVNLVKKKPVDLYTSMHKKLLPWFKKNHSKFSKITKQLIILFKDRSFLKSATMKYFYSETWIGRLKNWKKIVLKSVGRISNEVYQELKWFSLNFELFLMHLFPSLIQNINNLKKLYTSVFKMTGKIPIKTVDGANLFWSFYSTITHKIKTYNVTTKKYISTSIKQQKDSLTSSQLISRVRRLILPNIIHSLDAGILRILITELYTKMGHRLVHLHDAFTCNPVYLDNVYKILSKFYKKSKNSDWLNQLIFAPIRELIADLDKKKKSQIERIINGFNVKKCTIKCRHFSIENVYPLH